MALKDFKQYLVHVQGQYLEMKQDLADFEQAFKDGYITEDKLTDVKDTIAQLETNYQRLLYVAYILEKPNRKDKKRKFEKQASNVALENAFDNMGASESAVFDENKSLLDDLRTQLKDLTK